MTADKNKLLANEILNALSSLEGWGSLEIFVQDNKVTQITKRSISKTNFDLSSKKTNGHKTYKFDPIEIQGS